MERQTNVLAYTAPINERKKFMWRACDWLNMGTEKGSPLILHQGLIEKNKSAFVFPSGPDVNNFQKEVCI